MYNFEVLNRNFTTQEVEQFLNNEDLKKLGKRRYIYNPMIFGSPEEYKMVYERLNSGKRYLNEMEKKRIATDNQAKNENGETVRLFTKRVDEMIDYTGRFRGKKNGSEYIGTPILD